MFTAILAATVISASPADTWPMFRGTGDSISQAGTLPLEWDEKSGVAWKTELPGYGQSSPVVWRNRVFVTAARGDEKETAVVSCLELGSGRLLWSREFASSQPAEVNGYISRAAPTPVVDGQRIYAFFETGNLVALTHDGEPRWQRSLTDDYGNFQGNHGLGSSLAITGAAVIVLVEHEGPSYLLAVDKSSGKTLWKADRAEKVSWSSPIVADDGRIILSSAGTCESIDAKTGKRLWIIEGIEGNTVPSATATSDTVVVASSDVGSNLAIHRPAKNHVADAEIVWRSKAATASFCSPLVYREAVYVVNRSGVAFCLDAQTGQTRWTLRIGDSCWASPLGALDRVYFFDKSGRTTVVAATSGPQPKVLAENLLPTTTRVYGVAAIEGRVIIRTGSRVTCVGPASTKQEAKNMPSATQRLSELPAFPDLPQAVTSFGAARMDDAIYIYGGHYGRAHHYYAQGQSGQLLRLKLDHPAAWDVVDTGERRQGLALVAHGGKLYRIGGLIARNQEEDEQDLWSTDEFARYDPAAGEWVALPAMPVPRSSFDAVVDGDTLYVIGGWSMQGSKDAMWHQTAFAANLADAQPQWRELAAPPFQRRALSVGAAQGRIYAIGGIDPDGNVTRNTAVFDPSATTWAEGPQLPGEDMTGFGTACCSLDGRLYVSTSAGELWRLAEDGQSWELAARLRDARFFHRMLAVGGRRLALIGGANMQSGKFAGVEIVETAH